MRTARLGIVATVALVVLGVSGISLPAFAGAGGTTDEGGDQPVVEKTVKDRSKKSGKTRTKKPPSQKELDQYKKDQRAELKRLEKLYQQCKQDAADDTAVESCHTKYLADRVNVLVDPRDVARQVVARLKLPASTPVLGPAPELNVYSPGDLVVNYPYWLSVPGSSRLSTTATADGLTLSLTANRTKAVFDMGNGDTVACTTMLPWPGRDHELDRQGRPVVSPVCGYRYPDRGIHTITATVTWDVTWSGGGLSGVIRVTHADSVRLKVIELHSVNR